ncbi:FadR/GntR family transcriptional regulator [Desulfogranum mediterraneum]|uniref:FadR/GntR family transcriptional regulator n=1 Tax=Desulfogranum mediterraneum TaxID=160661 RepID=UPI000405E5C7|nr:FCD domain-containing protein [Desulfogranum mediterraneum]
MQGQAKRTGDKGDYRSVIAAIREMVVAGAIRPGDRLPAERKLAASLELSRSTVRQAFQALAERGILESRQGDGNYLLLGAELFSPGDQILDALNGKGDMVAHILELRRVMEPQIAALAAARITAKELEQLRSLVDQQQAAIEAGSGGYRQDAAFHRLLVQACGNPVIQELMASLTRLLDATRSPWFESSSRSRASLAGHRLILAALELGDQQAAARAMGAHLKEVEHHIRGE